MNQTKLKKILAFSHNLWKNHATSLIEVNQTVPFNNIIKPNQSFAPQTEASQTEPLTAALAKTLSSFLYITFKAEHCQPST